MKGNLYRSWPILALCFFSCSSGGWYITSLFDWFFSGGSEIAFCNNSVI